MLTIGQRFRLTTDIVALEPFEDRMCAISIPADAVIRVVRDPCPDDDRMVNAVWDSLPVVLFGRDLVYRAELLKSIAARAQND